jgi:hypothetical protein
MQKRELPEAVCREAFPHDPDFPQLETAVDPKQMLEVFRRHLRPAPGRACWIEACVPFRFRCRQSTSRCVLQYTLTLSEPGMGRRWEQWVTGLIYTRGGEAERMCRELQGAVPREGIPGDWLVFEPVDYIRELDMLVQVFPFDRKLPHLCRVLGGSWRGLESVVLAGLGPGRWRAERGDIKPTRYRTELGAALKYTVQAREALSGQGQARSCYLKVYRHNRREQVEFLRSLSQSAESGAGGFSVIKPIAYVEELRTVALEEAAGTPLQQVLVEGRDAARALCAAARAVAAFNQGTLQVQRHHTRADQCDDVRRASTLVQWACPEKRADVKALTLAVTEGLEDGPPSPIHRDLKTDHIFLSEDRVIFIDLDSAAWGDPVRDPAHLWAHITGRVGMDGLSKERAQAAAGLFAEEYFARVPKVWRRRFSLHCAGALIEVAGGIFKRQEPGWRQTLPELIEEAQRAAAGEPESGAVQANCVRRQSHADIR